MPSSASRDRALAKLLPALERLLDSGMSLTEITISRLASEAGIARRTFYLHFEDKAALLLSLASRDVSAEFKQTSLLMWSLPHAASQSEVQAVFGEMATRYAPHRSLLRALAEAATYDPAVAQLYDHLISFATNGVEQYIRAGQQNGAVRAGIDTRVMAQWLTVLVSTAMPGTAAAATPADRERRLDALASIYWRALYLGADE